MPNYIDTLAQQLGTQGATGLVGAGMGLLMQGGQDRRQLKQSGKLQGLQMQGQKEMMDYGYGKQLQMWKDTNYSAQIEQMKQAGINPGLLYGMSGGGGTTTGTPGTPGPSGQQAPHGGGEALAMAQTTMQLGLQRAQQRNIEADTELKKIDATKRAGVDTEKTATETKSISQGIINQEAQEKLTRMQTVWQEIQNSIGRQTIVDAMKIIENTVSKQEQEIKAMKLQNQLNERQMEDKINLLKYQAAGQILENVKTNAQTENIKQDTLVKIQQVTSMIKEIIMKGTDLASEVGLRERIGSDIAGVYDELPNPVQDILKGLGIIISPIKGGGHKPVTGFTPKKN